MLNVTTATHNIFAAYTVGDTHEWEEVDLNGDDFAEIVADQLDFWNDAYDLAGEFTVARTFHPDDFTTVTEIVGKVYGFRDGDLATDIVETVTVHVTAVER